MQTSAAIYNTHFNDELFLEERNNTWNTPFLFNGKELDEETGLYYYGARYYNPRISLWYGVDPLAEKYPSMSPFAYCANNPVIFNDIDGRDWNISRKVNEDGSQTINLKLTVAVHNASSKNIDMQNFANVLSSQVKKSYGISYSKTTYDIATMESGMDNFPSRNILIAKATNVNVIVDVDVETRVISSRSNLKANEHLVQIQNDSELPGVYGRVNDIGGREVYINERFVPNMLNGNDNNTLVHELGHTLGLGHIYQKEETFFEMFLWGTNLDYMPPSEQSKQSTNAMFSGGSKYMNDESSINFNGQQIEKAKAAYDNGNINK